MTSEGGTGSGGAKEMLKLFQELDEHRERAAAAERERQEEKHAVNMRLMQQQVEMLQGLVERERRGDESTRGATGAEPVKLTKLAEGDDIEAYLTTFERVMHVAHIDDSTWAVSLAPQLIGKAKQAYAAMSDEDSADYQMVKAAILKRYDIS